MAVGKSIKLISVRLTLGVSNGIGSVCDFPFFQAPNLSEIIDLISL